MGRLCRGVDVAPVPLLGAMTGAVLRQRSALITAGALAIYFGLIIFAQILHGAGQASFDGYPDEAAHYLSGEMVRDYLRSGFPHSPKAFASDYYLRIPFFAIGYWPPLFYLVEALWMSLFGASRSAVLVLIAVIAALGATLIFSRLRPLLGNLVAFCCGWLFLLMPIVQWSYMLVMTDLAIALLGFAALISYACYLESERAGYLVAFTLLTTLTVLTKSSGLYLLGVPCAALIVTRRFQWMKRWSFWLVPLGVAVLYTPWLIISREFANRGLAQRPELWTSFPAESWGLINNMALLTPLAIWGTWRALRAGLQVPPLIAVCLVQPVLLLIFLMIAPIEFEARYLIPALPPLIVLGGYGIHSLAGNRKIIAGLALVLVAAGAARAALAFPRRAQNHIRAVAEFVVNHADPPYHAVLVSADEGAMIAEIVQLERRRSDRFLLRSTKLLVHTGWLGQNYEVLYKTTAEVQALFDRIALDVAIVRLNPPPNALPHETMVNQAIQASPERWRKVYPPPGQASYYAAYELIKSNAAPTEDLEKFLRELIQLSASWHDARSGPATLQWANWRVCSPALTKVSSASTLHRRPRTAPSGSSQPSFLL